MSRPLEPYFQKLNRKGHYFALHTPSKSPQLQPGKMNRILLYPGCFNPPHIGHSSLVEHVFTNSGEDLNIIAAIIMPKGDDLIEKKLKGSDNQLKLTKSERVKLWEGHEPSDYLWVYAGPEEDWDSFRDTLIRDTARDGFEVKISLLCGPEYVEYLEDRSFGHSWGCDEFFSSDVSRDSTVMHGPPGHMVPRQLRRHSPWERTVIAGESINDVNVWACHRNDGEPAFTVRFVSKPEGTRGPRTSSTDIRDSLRDVRRLRSGELRGRARNLVLRPDLLAGMVFKPLP